MNQVTYCVLYYMGDWQIFSNGVFHGPHRSAEAAINTAIAAAERAKKYGEAATVFFQPLHGNMQVIWQYGQKYFAKAA